MNAPSPAQALADPRLPANRLSLVAGTCDEPLSDWTIGSWLDHTADLHGAAVACVFHAENLRWNWAQLRTEADRLAAGLLTLGFARGDRVGIWAPNRSEWILAQYASARLGLILVNINPAYRIAEHRVPETADPRAVTGRAEMQRRHDLWRRGRGARKV